MHQSNSCSTKTPILLNGNKTYNLRHTRYSTFPTTTTAISSTNAFPGTADEDGMVETAISGREAELLASEPIGFSRDEPIGNQIRDAIGDGPWNKRVGVLFSRPDFTGSRDNFNGGSLSRTDREFYRESFPE